MEAVNYFKEELKSRMKKKFTRILGVGLSLILLTSLMVMAVPASAGTMSLTDDKDIPKTATYVLQPASFNLVDVAASGDTIYVATSNATYPLFKSTDGGTTWADLSGTTSFPSSVSVTAVDIASDDDDVVIILHSGNEVEISENGGSSWTDLNAPTYFNSFTDVAVSSGTTRYVALVGSDNTSEGELWTLKASAGSSWAVESGESGFKASQTTVNAVEFSPNYSTDKIITVVSGTATTATFQVFAYTSSTVQNWNDSISGWSSDWSDGVSLTTGVSSSISAASIALPSDYLGTDEGARTAFVGVASGNSSDESVWRLTDSVKKGYDRWDDGLPGPVGSVAYNDSSGVLLAGDYDGIQVYSWLTPMSGSSPNAQRVKSLQQPGGDSDVIVAWAGDAAVSVSTGDESAFSVSTDDGYSFTDTALIDTALNVIDDVAINADASKIYLATHDTAASGTADTSIWLKEDGNWTRIHSNDDVTTANSDYLIRLAPEDDSVVYISSTGTTSMWRSDNSGKTSGDRKSVV